MQLTNNQFFAKINELFTANKPFVAYRKPNEELVSLIHQNNQKLYELHGFNESGFIFVPFHKLGKRVIFPINESTVYHSVITQFNEVPTVESYELKEINHHFQTSKKEHIALIQKGVDFITNENALKIVLSRKEVLEFSHFNMIHTFKKMLNNYKNAFVYVWFHPEIGLWMGATPERLLTIKNNNFVTMSLAGTQPFLGDLNVVWKEKEQVEQQIVTDFILESLKDKIKITEIKGPYTVKAGSLLHLRTDIIGQLDSANLLESLVESLHPTPAVCGLPKETAVQFILKNENYKRTYYSGYLGELNMNGNSQLVVNLRCMEIKNNQVLLFVGGGITKGSVPEKEFEETVAKAMVMKKVL